MIEQLKKAKNTLVFLPKDDISIRDSLEYTLGNVIVIDKVTNQCEILNFINKNKIKKIFLNGYNSLYEYLLPRLKKEINVCWIFNSSFSNMSNNGVRNTFHQMMDYIDRDLVTSIGCISIDNYKVFNNLGFKCEIINLDIKSTEKTNINNNTIGVLSNDIDPRNNIYNQLASLTLIDYDYCKLSIKMKKTNNFLKKFNIKYQKEKSLDNIISNNFVNLYINFTNTNTELIKKSFNYGVPCLVGNTNYFNNSEYLKEHLVVKSDDDINEIAQKIVFVKNNYDNIIKEYRNKEWK